MRVLGLISGTSADAVEAVLADIEGAPPSVRQRIVAGSSTPLPADVRERIHAVAAGQGDARAVCLLGAELGERFAAAALELIADAGLRPADIDLIGSHGQTIWHAVRDDGSVAGTLQVGDAAVIAERTGITTVSDLRARDVAAGGQGAPLVAYLDWLLLRHAERPRALQNLGGIGNVCLLPPLSAGDTRPLAFDTGPANALIDILVSLLTDGRLAFDEDGRMAARGTVDEGWLIELLEHPYFGRRPPKTTGRELFGPAMARALLGEGRHRALGDVDILATVTALSADSVADQYRRFLPTPPQEVIVSGGGARNPVLMARLVARLPPGTRVRHLEELGIPGHQKEALAMAVLAYETWHGRTGTLPELTGARHAVVLGSITPGRAPRAPGQPPPEDLSPVWPMTPGDA
jgi:anhydro-N-acetylmuramic acid kinase